MPSARPRSLPSTQPLLDRIGRLLPEVRVTAYDGCASGPADAPTRLSLTSPRALVRMVRAPRGLGLARAWIAGEVAIEGDLGALAPHERSLRDPVLLLRAASTGLRTALALGHEELRRAGATEVEYRGVRPGRHSPRSDRREIDFHYGLSPEFYRLMLGPSLTYSCALFDAPKDSLETAQARKHAVIAEKLRLDAASTVLDIGCGWGSFLLDASTRTGCGGIGVTASRAQYDVAAGRLREAGDVSVHCCDYRELLPVRGVTAAVSIGMYEHVGASKSERFFRLVRDSLPRGARYLNQAIFRMQSGPARFRRNSFAERYIFPNGQLLPLAQQLRDLERAGFRILSAQNYGASYARTLRHWSANLCAQRERCVQLEGEARVRAWEMYLAGARRRFEDGAIDLTQVLAEAV